MDFKSLDKIFFSGIGGIGVSALAKYFLSLGKEVFGSDSIRSEITEELEKMGVKITYSQEADNIKPGIDLVIYTPAENQDHVERARAADLKIDQLSYPQALGELMKEYEVGMAICGTNGKSTTTALLGAILEEASFDPTVVVGSKIKQFGNSNFKQGHSQYMLVEACEYKASFLNLWPQIIGLSNIEEDHLDYFTGLEHIIETFQDFINRLSPMSILAINADDKNSQKLNIPNCQLVTYGIKSQADVVAQEIRVENGQQIFKVIYQGGEAGTVELKIPGQHNIYNALLAICLALSLGIDFILIKKALTEFSGLWRRFEVITERAGIVYVSDYAHHPTAVKETIKAARDFYPQRRIVVAYQPHQHNRTLKLFDQFVGAFSGADLLVMSEIYDVEGRNEDSKVSANDLVKKISKRGVETYFATDLAELVVMLKDNLKSNDVLLVMGAGDIYTILPKLIQA